MPRCSARLGLLAGGGFLTVALLGSAVATASATTPGRAGAHPSAQAALSPVGTTNLFIAQGGGGFTAQGTLTITAGGTWSASASCEGGFWTQSGKTVTLASDGCALHGIWSAKLGKHGLGTASHPGTYTLQGHDATLGTFYTQG